MPDLRLIDKLKEFLMTAQGKDLSLDHLRKELKLDPNRPEWQSIRKTMFDLVKDGLVKPSGRNDGVFKVIVQVKPVKVFGRERRGKINFNFPIDQNTGEEMSFARDIVFREGDLILISGVSNYGKTAFCLNLTAQNIEAEPVLMGNEYTGVDNEPTARFLDRIDRMTWLAWAYDDGNDRFTLLPVRDDFADHVIRDKINIIDWINTPSGEFFLISKISEDIKRAVGKGIAVAVIQMGQGADAGRGGQFTRDFADVELLLSPYGNSETLLVIGKVKESLKRVSGRAFAFTIQDGVKIISFRELLKCGCLKGWRGTKKCENCNGSGWREGNVSI